jgi:hypothetical protein
MLGQHTVEVLTTRLGMDEAEVRQMAEDGIVSVWPESS